MLRFIHVSSLGKTVLAKTEEGMGGGKRYKGNNKIQKQNRTRHTPRMGHLLGKNSEEN